MRDNRKKPHGTDRKSRLIRPRSATGRAGDARSKKLANLGKKLGNNELSAKMKTADKQADALLSFIVARLEKLHLIQNSEFLEMGDARQWYKKVANAESGFFLPDPTRWHESAAQYKKAAEAICNGNLGRGADLMERAMEAERAALTSMPVQVRENLKDEEKRPDNAPVELNHVSNVAACTTRAMPAELVHADRILAMQEQMRDQPPVPLQNMLMWFERTKRREAEETQDEDDDK